MLEPSSLIRFAVVGCGHAGRRHLHTIQANERARLVAIADQIIPSDLAHLPHFASLEALLANTTDIDVVVIATPNGLHEEQAVQVLQRGFHVLIEKPMALSKTGAERILYTALQRDRKVFCVMQNRYTPLMAWLKDISERDLWGKVHLVQLSCFWNRGQGYYAASAWRGTQSLDGGPLFTQFSHFIDAVYWLFGDVKQVLSAHFANYAHPYTEGEDTGTFTLSLQRGGLVTGQYTTAAYEKNAENSLTILSENGAVKIGGQYADTLVYAHTAPNWPTPPAHSAQPTHAQVIDNVVDTLRGKTAIKTNALEALKVVEIIEKIYAFKQPITIA